MPTIAVAKKQQNEWKSYHINCYEGVKKGYHLFCTLSVSVVFSANVFCSKNDVGRGTH